MKARDFGKVAVLLGGKSSEREISLMSGTAVLEALQRQGVDAHAFDTGQRDLSDFAAEKFDRAFVILHGRYGEDGTIQGALDLMGVPYTGSGVMACALALDKWRTKLVWQACDIPTPRFEMLHASSNFISTARELGVPMIIKPAREGSTIGLSKVNDANEFEAAYREAAKYDPLVMAEQYIDGPELTAAILEDESLPLVRIEAPGHNYDYNAKYFSDETKYFCPSGIAPDLEDRIKRLCADAYRIIGCSGWGRVDVMLDGDDQPWILEVNTVPGMTGHSLVPMAAKATGLSFDQLVMRILEGARVE
ncbi:MAG: D-alanine--D-alanine ligase [Betaproteobacteria bacterium]|nr:MAG: D-alanine--D-alanine ligase [Betaproteobacteria bacterium]